MPLASGTRLGPYEILAPIGAGGMGEVYKARDTRLGRDVAIKVSNEDFTERFEREARSIAALNHPNICHLYDVGPNYLVMELIEGSALKGPLPLDKALDYARQILDALDAAHSKGITHRDLKPANILVTKTGIKLLDFGLAKQTGSLKETDVTQPLTQQGAIVGTLNYMSPEQLQSKEADARSDIFSFGLVLFEMLYGKRAFEGESAASVIAAILERPAPSVAEVASLALDRVLKTCLAKDPEERWQTARDLKRELEWIASTPAEIPVKPALSRLRSSWAAGVIALMVVTLPVAIWAPWRSAPASPRQLRLEITPPRGVTLASSFAISPDGSRLAYAASGTDRVYRLWLRALDTLESRVLPGTENPRFLFWSYDSRFIAFVANGKLMKIDVAGTAPQTLCDAEAVFGGTWNRDDTILFGINNSTGIQRVSASGGVPVSVTTFDGARKDASHLAPVFLPDGRHFLYLVLSADSDRQGIYVGSLHSKPDQQDSRRLLATAFGAAFVPSSDGSGGAILFDHDGTLLAQRLDLRRMETIGEAVPLVEHLGNTQNLARFTASDTGTLVYGSGTSTPSRQLVWFDRQGKSVGVVGTPQNYFRMALSPDEGRIATARVDGSSTDIWLTTVSSGSDTRLTFDGRDFDPIWSPDGSRIAFTSDRGGQFRMYQRAVNGVGQDELLVQSDHHERVADWSRDGRFLLYLELDPKMKDDVWALPMNVAPGERKPIAVERTPAEELYPSFSPDGHWIAYTSDESGRSEVYVRPFPPEGSRVGKWLVSQNSGFAPRWRGDGKELFYVSEDGNLVAVSVNIRGTAFERGTSVLLFKVPATTDFNVTRDGRRFLFAVPSGDAVQARFTVVLNWMSLLKR